jgi:uracil-DNA glycosylase family protein
MRQSGYRRGMTQHRPDASSYVPASRSLRTLRAAATGCRGCPLHAAATRTVFGEGPRASQLMLVGEMPGDHEDRAGRVFVGPAGRELDRALAAAGIARDDIYITNAVKHFKFEQRGKRRIHSKPSRWEVRACNPWLRAELDAVRPRALVLLGATAGQALIGPSFKLGEALGRRLDCDLAEHVIATAHPSAILRARDRDARDAMRASLARDLQNVASVLAAAR